MRLYCTLQLKSLDAKFIYLTKEPNLALLMRSASKLTPATRQGRTSLKGTAQIESSQLVSRQCTQQSVDVHSFRLVPEHP
jgi:hypothetical protein